MEKKKYPIGAEFYVLYEEVGQGVSAAVHRALCIPFAEIVAIKILDFERDNIDLSNISREVQTMILVDHPNVLKSHCSFVSDHNLWVVMPFMSGGSCLHILKAAHPDGFEEMVIATILREVLKGLEYLHHHGQIHRDVKAGNILMDARGAVKLGDFGVSACLFDSGDRQRMRNTFVGTPCWMAPEVMEQLHGYDFKADIWSFGITGLELAHGHAPFSKYPPMKVLLMTLQNAPPSLDYERDKKFSKSFKQMIASCLVKDPSKRPSAKKLLKHSFFKQARSNDYIARTLLEGLPALGDRIQALKRKEEDMLAQKKMPDGQKEEISQNEYKRGISGWNFNLDDMKAQASLIQDVEDSASDTLGGSSSSLCTLDAPEKQLEAQLLGQVPEVDGNGMTRSRPAPLQMINSFVNIKIRGEKSDDDFSLASPCYEQLSSSNPSPRPDFSVDSSVTEKPIFEINGKQLDSIACQHKTGGQMGGSNLPENAVPPIKEESDKVQNQSQNNASPEDDDVLSEIQPRAPKLAAPNNDEDEKTKPPIVQQRGRFKVTSENVGIEKVPPLPVLQKSHSMQVLHQSPGLSISPSPDISSSILNGLSLYTQLNALLQTNIVQRDNILNLMRQLCDTSTNRSIDGGNAQAQLCFTERSLLEASSEREKEMLNEITDLQWRLIRSQEELQKYKAENAQVL
ncbi:serine/threonine-protein kinase BLUS1 isoform X2 [Euphorbia lathyris]|uniref:serine/threonine-protein kinase BLUS1 isoform X2 n=1 Tax=Euphorbia lathyris TaxID=212925 RepID=UPI00331392BB